MKRWLVVFRSHPLPPVDSTVVDVTARSMLGAIAKARREALIPHPWHLVTATLWPRGCADIDAAVAKMAASR